jgi:hypothetical protein
MALYIGGTALLLHFEGADGATTVLDSSGRARTISSYYGASLRSSARRFGGTSLQLDGIDDHLRTTQTGDAEYQFGTGAFTIECWACLQNTSGNRCLIDFNESNPFRVVWSDTQLRLQSGHATVLSSPELQWDPNTFYHVAVVRVGSEVTLYRDGQPLGVWSTTASLDLGAGRTVFIGCNRGDTWFWQGYIDELRIVNGVALYPAAFTPPDAPLEPIVGTPIATQVVDFSGSRFITNNPTLGGARVAIRWHPIGLARLARFDASVYPLPIRPLEVDLRDRFPYGLYLAPQPALGAAWQDGWGQRAWPWEFKGTGRITGTVKEVGVQSNLQSNLPVHRRVRLYRERDGALVREVWSDPASGTYTFPGVPMGERYTVLSHDHQRNFRAVIADNLAAESML